MQTVAQTHFSHSKADFCEMLPDTLSFLEYLFADSYSFRGQVHFWNKKTPAPVRKQTANQRLDLMVFISTSYVTLTPATCFPMGLLRKMYRNC